MISSSHGSKNGEALVDATTWRRLVDTEVPKAAGRPEVTMAWCLTTRTIQGVMGRENAAAVARETERVTGGRLPDLDHLAERIMIPIGTGIDGEAGVGRGTRGEEVGIERAEEDVRKDVTGGGTFAVLAWGLPRSSPSDFDKIVSLSAIVSPVCTSFDSYQRLQRAVPVGGLRRLYWWRSTITLHSASM